MIAARTNHLRERGGSESARVTYVELFFDLVFVFAVTQLSHGLLHHLTLAGAVETGMLMMAVWWVTGATFADMPWSRTTLAAFAVTFVGSVAMWLVYFNIGAERASRRIAQSRDPGRLARSGYTYLHIVIVAGIIVSAVADELVLSHPTGHTELKSLLVIVGGPALYLVGTALFKTLTAPVVPLSHLVGLGLLALVASSGMTASPLILSAGTAATLIVVAIWEWASLRRRG